MVKRKSFVSSSKFMHFHDKQSWLSEHKKKHLHTLPLGGLFIHCLRRGGKSIVDGTFCSDLSHKVLFAIGFQDILLHLRTSMLTILSQKYASQTFYYANEFQTPMHGPNAA